MKMNIYEIRVYFGQGECCDGTYSIKAYSEEEALNKAVRELDEKFSHAFPTLSCDIIVEIETIKENIN